jgi:hypothetical protein
LSTASSAGSGSSASREPTAPVTRPAQCSVSDLPVPPRFWSGRRASRRTLLLGLTSRSGRRSRPSGLRGSRCRSIVGRIALPPGGSAAGAIAGRSC